MCFESVQNSFMMLKNAKRIESFENKGFKSVFNYINQKQEK